MPDRLFRDRRDAGRVMAGLLDQYRDRPDVLVLGLARGGVPVGYEVAAALSAPLDVFLVRKLGVPGRQELAMGAIASGGVIVINDDVVRGLGIAPETIQRVAEEEGRELQRREQAYREGRPAPDVAGKVVILADDGLATGASMRAAVQALRQLGPARIVVAVPAAPESACRELTAMADEVVCATTPLPFFAVGASYWDFTEVTDEEVRDLLRAAATSRPTGAGAAGPTEAAIIRAEAAPVEEGVPSDGALSDLVGDAQFGRVSSWNLRDQHMAGTLDALAGRPLRRCARRGQNGPSGVIYRPATERQSHYFRSRVADQFDAVIHIEETRAVEPLERTAGWELGEVPDTYPFTV